MIIIHGLNELQEATGGTQPLTPGFDKERTTEESEAPMTDPIRTSVRPNPANTEALHGGDTLDAAGVTLTAPRRHGATHGSRATDHFTSSTPSGASDTIRRATRAESHNVSNERRETARRLLAQLEAIPVPADPRASIPPRPRETIRQMTDRQHGEAMEAIATTTIGAVIPLGGTAIHGLASRHAVRAVGEAIEVGGGAVVDTAAAVRTGRRDGLEAGVDSGIEGSLDVAAEQLGAAIGQEGGPPLLQGAFVTLMSAGRNLQSGAERRELAGQWSEYDRRRNEANDADRTGRMNGEALLRLYKRGEIQEIDFGRASGNYAEYMTLRSGLRDLVGGR